MRGAFAAVVGRVTDGGGRPVRGHDVVLRSESVEIRTQTDDRGRYEFPSAVVGQGTFTLEIGEFRRELTLGPPAAELVLADATVPHDRTAGV